MRSQDNNARLCELLNKMNIPSFRTKLTESNARWLLRNLRIHNSDHPNIEEAIKLLKDFVRTRREKDCPNPGCHCGACG